jgi:molybdenum cofactor guanylyltransferase
VGARVDTPLGVLLAGGRSARFAGGPKGLASLGHGRVCDPAIQALRTTCARVMVSVAPDAPHRDAVAAAIPELTILHDPVPGLGPIGGLLAALRAANGAPVLTVAWDMPFVTPATLQILLDALRRGLPCAVPELVPDQREPLCAGYGAACLPIVEQMVATGELSPRLIVDRMRTHGLDARAFASLADPARMFTSIDTRDALDAVRAMWDPSPTH